jgi:hypothetical protein
MDSGACATAYLAHTSWQFGEIERAALSLAERRFSELMELFTSGSYTDP